MRRWRAGAPTLNVNHRSLSTCCSALLNTHQAVRTGNITDKGRNCFSCEECRVTLSTRPDADDGESGRCLNTKGRQRLFILIREEEQKCYQVPCRSLSALTSNIFMFKLSSRSGVSCSADSVSLWAGLQHHLVRLTERINMCVCLCYYYSIKKLLNSNNRIIKNKN